MPSTNIKTILYSDSSNDIVDKLNNNFDEIVELHGGSEGILGPTGGRGPIGERGPMGPTGIPGPRGTRWFIQPPTVQPAGYAQEGDYWIDSESTGIYQLSSTGWEYTGYDVNSSGVLFSALVNQYLAGPGYAGGTAVSVSFDQILPENYLYTVTDVTPEFGSTNESLSKFSIGLNTSINDSPILEFSKSNLENGQISDFTKHPVFNWIDSNPNDNSLGFYIPGGSFNVGLSGGFSSNFNSLSIDSKSELNIDYGSSTSGGIFSTGGFNFQSPSGEFNITSQFLRIVGGSAEFRNPIVSSASLSPFVASSLVYVGGTAGVLFTRSGDTHSTLSHSVNHIRLETQGSPQFYLNTKGKLLTNKTIEPFSYTSGIPGATGTVSSNYVSWYLISKPGTNVNSSILENGNTVIISPSVNEGNIGVGFYYSPDNNFGWGATSSGGLKPGESMDVKVLLSTNASSGFDFSGIRYIGVGATSGTVTNKVSLPVRVSVIDFTIAKGVTGSSANTLVYYKAYGPTGGYGGSFNF